MNDALTALERQNFAARIHQRDGSLWSDDPAVQQTARNRLGWLDTPEQMLAAVEALRAFADQVYADGFRHAVVLGMGGSSLAPEVLRETFGDGRDPEGAATAAHGLGEPVTGAAGAPTGAGDASPRRALTLDVLDSTDPEAVLSIERRLDLDRTLFIVATKSGTTTETASFMEHFWSLRPNGHQFVAITDPGSALERLAGERGFRRVFAHPADVGGRYAALTYIGLVPAAVLGIDVKTLLDRAVAMARACAPGTPAADNPGVSLGAAIGGPAKQGRDKLTLLCSPAISAFGYWVEQLVAESTGKAGTGILPVEGEPLGSPAMYGDDRLFIYLRLSSEPDAEQDAAVEALETAGQPVLRLALRDRYDLGGQFFRWEYAVAAACAVLGVEPFDQPNVEESKANTNRLLAHYIEHGSLPEDAPLLTDGGVRLFAQDAVAGAIGDARTLVDALRRALRLVEPADYVAITAYIPATAASEQALDDLRVMLRDSLRVATTTGYGPRFLHSTGQLHKGDRGNGVFIQFTSEPSEDLPVPGKPYTFAVLKAAQALGDLQALQSRGRRALRLDLGRDVAGGLRRVEEALRANLLES